MSSPPRETRVHAADRFDARGGRKFLFVVFELPYFDLSRALAAGAKVFVEVSDRRFSQLAGALPHVSNPEEARGSLGVSPPPEFEVVAGARVELRYPGER